MNLTNTFPTDGTAYPVNLSGLGTTTSYIFPYLIDSYFTSTTKSL